MAVSYFYIDKKYRQLISEFQEKGILGFKEATTWHIFCLAMAMGINHPADLGTRESYSRVEYLKSDFRSKAMIEAVSIARAQNNSEVDVYSTLESVEEYTERLANAGFAQLQEKYNEIVSRGEGKELFERRLESELETLFLQNVENNI